MCPFKWPDIAHIAFVRFLVRVNTHVLFQSTSCAKTLLAHIALVLPSLPLHSFRKNSSFFFPHLMILFHTIVTRHAHEHPQQSLCVVFFSLFFSLFFFSVITLPHHDHRFYVFRSFRMFILSSARHRKYCVVFFFLFPGGKWRIFRHRNPLKHLTRRKETQTKRIQQSK